MHKRFLLKIKGNYTIFFALCWKKKSSNPNRYGKNLHSWYLLDTCLAPKKPGKDGEVGVQYINMAKISDRKRNELDSKTKKSYPLAVINIIRREAEDLLLSNSNDKKGRDSLMFILSLTNERSDLKTLKKGKTSYVPFITLT